MSITAIIVAGKCNEFILKNGKTQVSVVDRSRGQLALGSIVFPRFLSRSEYSATERQHTRHELNRSL